VHECVQWLKLDTVAASPLDQSAVNATSGTTYDSTATAATAQADDWLWGLVSANGSAQTPNQPGGWTAVPTTPTFSVAGTVCARSDFQAVSATGTYNYSAGFSSGTVFYAAGIIAFKAGGAAGAVLLPFEPHRMPLGC
jgi:hypothetical protein